MPTLVHTYFIETPFDMAFQYIPPARKRHPFQSPSPGNAKREVAYRTGGYLNPSTL